MTTSNYYRILEVEENADDGQIREAYRKLALRHHPDRNADSAASAERMKAVNEAYAILSDPQKRSEYDALRGRFGASAHERFRENYSEQDIFRGSDIGQILEEMAKSFGVRGVDDIFSEFYGPQYRSFEFRRPGFRARGFFYFGGLGGGKGRGKGRRLPGRGGMGRLTRRVMERLGAAAAPRDGGDLFDVLPITADLAASGGPYAYYHRQHDKKLVVGIPPGVREGQKIRLAGMGEAGANGGRPGDLFLKVRIQKSLVKRLSGWAGRLIGR